MPTDVLMRSRPGGPRVPGPLAAVVWYTPFFRCLQTPRELHENVRYERRTRAARRPGPASRAVSGFLPVLGGDLVNQGLERRLESGPHGERVQHAPEDEVLDVDRMDAHLRHDG